MADARSNPSQRNPEPGPRIGATRKVGGSQRRSIPQKPIAGGRMKAPRQASVAKGTPQNPVPDHGGGYVSGPGAMAGGFR